MRGEQVTRDALVERVEREMDDQAHPEGMFRGMRVVKVRDAVEVAVRLLEVVERDRDEARRLHDEHCVTTTYDPRNPCMPPWRPR